jgi:hypothetical protein
MDFDATLRALRQELEMVNASIASLERLAAASSQVAVKQSKRGRKSMGAEERVIVSDRMRKYWAGRRQTTDQNSNSLTGAGTAATRGS